jgi:UDP-N-acetylmuramoyl-tripeptide--D-alanyl-D-alanine ligase
MGELGAQSVAEHDALGRYAVRLNISRLVAVGADARAIAQGAAHEGSYDGEAQWVSDIEAAVALVTPQLRPGDVVLVKASRAAGFERLAAALTAASEPRSQVDVELSDPTQSDHQDDSTAETGSGASA